MHGAEKIYILQLGTKSNIVETFLIDLRNFYVSHLTFDTLNPKFFLIGFSVTQIKNDKGKTSLHYYVYVYNDEETVNIAKINRKFRIEFNVETILVELNHIDFYCNINRR